MFFCCIGTESVLFVLFFFLSTSLWACGTILFLATWPRNFSSVLDHTVRFWGTFTTLTWCNYINYQHWPRCDEWNSNFQSYFKSSATTENITGSSLDFDGTVSFLLSFDTFLQRKYCENLLHCAEHKSSFQVIRTIQAIGPINCNLFNIWMLFWVYQMGDILLVSIRPFLDKSKSTICRVSRRTNMVPSCLKEQRGRTV